MLIIDKLYNNAVYFFKYWYYMDIVINNSWIAYYCFDIQELVQFIADKTCLCVSVARTMYDTKVLRL